ncbi:iron chelate uptake ABC transporter family permease subunit, partial [Shewanella sp. C31]|nr:iron chelate uptake ABC transporter family permease subunit [Shewanella electrica]
VPLQGVKLLLLMAASLLTAAAVAQAGIIGCVGLITPQLLRRLVGDVYRVVLPASALGGALLLALADLLARTLTRPAELPVGVVTTLLGGPFFLY